MDYLQEIMFFDDSFKSMLLGVGLLSLYAQICHGIACFDVMSYVEKVYTET